MTVKNEAAVSCVEVCFTVLLSVISYIVLCCVVFCHVVLHCVVGIEQCLVVLCYISVALVVSSVGLRTKGE